MGERARRKFIVEIADALFNEARQLAAEKNLSLRSLVEEGLRLALQRHRSETHFEPRVVTFGGDGFQAEFEGGSWAALRDAAYERRGS